VPPPPMNLSASFFCQSPTPQIGQQLGTSPLAKRSRDYLAFVNSIPVSESIPYTEALGNKHALAVLEAEKRVMQEKLQKLGGMLENGK